MKKSYEPAEWQAIYRMADAGIPMDVEHLHRLAAPIRVLPVADASFSSLSTGTRLDLQVTVEVLAPVQIIGCDLRVPLLGEQLYLTEQCQAHKGYCVHPHFSVSPPSRALQYWFNPLNVLQRGKRISGILAAWSHSPCPREWTAEIGTLVLNTACGSCLRFPLKLAIPGVSRPEQPEG
jgi:hypothetical protein